MNHYNTLRIILDGLVELEKKNPPWIGGSIVPLYFSKLIVKTGDIGLVFFAVDLVYGLGISGDCLQMTGGIEVIQRAVI